MDSRVFIYLNELKDDILVALELGQQKIDSLKLPKHIIDEIQTEVFDYLLNAVDNIDVVTYDIDSISDNDDMMDNQDDDDDDDDDEVDY